MIYVLTDSYRTFRSFCEEFHLREDKGSGPMGSVCYISDLKQLRGINRGLVLEWQAPYGTSDEVKYEAQHICADRDIPFINVPDLRRQRARREHPEAFRRKW